MSGDEIRPSGLNTWLRHRDVKTHLVHNYFVFLYNWVKFYVSTFLLCCCNTSTAYFAEKMCAVLRRVHDISSVTVLHFNSNNANQNLFRSSTLSDILVDQAYVRTIIDGTQYLLKRLWRIQTPQITF